ncbi:MAG: MFS transporter [Nannocystaceae bacterium]|nr:MFS transporter [Myxococcales bacterium]
MDGADEAAPERGATRALVALSALYLAQGIVAGFGSFVLIPGLASAGVDLTTQAGVLAWGGLPWVLKLAWAPLLDRVAGPQSGLRRRAVAVALQLCCAGVAAAMTQIDLAGDATALALLWTVLNLFVSLQDVAADTLALDAIPERRRGLARGLMSAASHVGAGVLGSLVIAWQIGQAGYAAGIWLMAGLLAALALGPWALRRVDLDGARRSPEGSLRGALALLLTARRTRLGLLLALTAVLANGATSAIAGQYFVLHLGWTVERLGAELAPVITAVQLVGYGLAAALVDRLGHGRALGLGLIGMGVTWALFGLLDASLGSSEVLYALVTLEGLTTGLMYVGLYAALMDLTDSRARATQYVLYMATINLASRVIGPLAGPPLLADLGYAGAFIAAGVTNVLIGLSALALRLSRRAG